MSRGAARLGAGLGFLSLLAATSAQAAVVVETKPWSPPNSAQWPTMLREIDSEVSRGLFDPSVIQIPLKATNSLPAAEQKAVSHVGSALFLNLNSETISTLPANVRMQAIRSLASYYFLDDSGTYQVQVDPTKNTLGDEPVITRLGIATTGLTEAQPAEKLLSPYAQTWAYKISSGDGPNCWHTSISSISPGWTISRRMSAAEFVCQLGHSFTQIDQPSQWGDLIRIRDTDGSEIHGFTFLGTDSHDPSRRVVFTKNGRQQGYFLFMDLEAVKSIYPGSLSYWRATNVIPVDPHVNPSATCAGFPDDGIEDEESFRDPVLAAGLQKHDPRSALPAVRW